MPRHAPVIINERVDEKKGITVRLTESPGIWAVYYKGKPFGIQRVGKRVQYSKTSFPSPGHANALCNKLNKMFRCVHFTVVHLKEINR